MLATSVLPIAPAFEEIKGSIMIDPGCFFTIEGIGAGAGTSPLVVIGAEWEEYPINVAGGF